MPDDYYLYRYPEKTGLAGWIQALNSGATDESVQAAILGSAEFFGVHGGTNSTFVSALYQTLLERSASSNEINSWLTILQSQSRTFVAMSFLQSQEYRVDLITSFYNDYLQRRPDSSGLSTWLRALSQSTDESIQSAILGSSEFYALTPN